MDWKYDCKAQQVKSTNRRERVGNIRTVSGHFKDMMTRTKLKVKAHDQNCGDIFDINNVIPTKIIIWKF